MMAEARTRSPTAATWRRWRSRGAPKSWPLAARRARDGGLPMMSLLVMMFKRKIWRLLLPGGLFTVFFGGGDVVRVAKAAAAGDDGDQKETNTSSKSPKLRMPLP